MKKKAEQVQAENPETLLDLKLTAPKEAAAGIPGVVHAVQHVLNEMDPIRGFKALAKLNQKTGFDCPGCAWPDPDDERSPVAEYCENGAKAIAEEATTKKLGVDFFEKNSVAELSLLNDYEIGKKGRIAQPMYLAKGANHYTPISWDLAFEKIATHLKQLQNPDEAVFYTSGRTSNEAAFLYQLMVRQLGTNNLPDCSNMCHESSGVALNESLGIGKGSVTLEDFYIADVIVILGQNPGTNHPRMLSALQKAKANGCTIISVNPLPETGLIAFNNPQTLKGVMGLKSKLTDLFLQVKLNGDMALLKALSNIILKESKQNPECIDADFIAKHTHGFEEWKTSIEKEDLHHLAVAAGLELEQIQAAAAHLIRGKKIIACWAMGLTQHKNAVETIQEVVNILLMKGSIGKPGAGTCPVRGHSNVQGDRTMGIYEKPSPAFLNNIQKSFGFEPPQKHGYDVVEAIHAMHQGKVKVFMAMGGNFLSATPDTKYTAEALQTCDLTVQVSTKLNRSHLITGKEALILPCLSRSDQDLLNNEPQFISCENSMGVIQKSQGSLKPISNQLKSEPTIVIELALKLFGNDGPVNWSKYLQHYDYIRDDIEKAIPGFTDYNKRVRELGGFYLPNSSREGKFNELSSQKAHFVIGTLNNIHLNENELMMMTIRSHDQFNTTIYGLDDRYRGVFNERRVVFMNPEDCLRLGFKAGDLVDLLNFDDGIERVARKFVVVEFNIPKSCTATYFPEANVLVPIKSVAVKSNTPTSKMVIIQLRKHQDGL